MKTELQKGGGGQILAGLCRRRKGVCVIVTCDWKSVGVSLGTTALSDLYSRTAEALWVQAQTTTIKRLLQ